MSSETLLGSGQINYNPITQCDFCLLHKLDEILKTYKEYFYCEDCLNKFLEKNHFEFYSKSHAAYSYKLTNKTTGEN